MLNEVKSRFSSGRKLIISFVFLLIVHCTLTIDNCEAQWVLVSNGLTIGNTQSLAASGNYILAGGGGGVYLSTNNGTSWTQTSLNNKTVWALAVRGINIFAGTAGYGVYLSSNNGTSWTQTSLNQDVYTFAFYGNNIFAGAYGVYISTNIGTSWIQTSLNNREVWSLSANENNVFAGTANDGLFLSTNNGTNWIQTSLINQNVWSLAINGNNIFAGTLQGVFLSTNNGTNWTQTSLNNRAVYALATNGNNLFAATEYYGVYVSNNNGVDWIQRNEGLYSINTVVSFCIINNFIFASLITGFPPGVYRRPIDELIGIEPISSETPKSFSLSQNFPNPFNPSTKIKFDIPPLFSREGTGVSLVIFDILGHEVSTLINEQLKPGSYEVEFNGSNYPSGVYFYKLIAGDYTESRKMLLVK